MKLLKIVAIILILCGVIFLSISCSSSAGSTSTVKTQIATVQKGSLSVAVTGTGNLALSRTEDLAFEVAGYVEEVLVSEGDSVKEGQELAKVDTSEWDKQLKTLQNSVVAAQRNLITKESAVTAAERKVTTQESTVTTAERKVTTQEFAVRQAQVDVQTAEYNLSQIADVKKAQDAVDNAEYALKFAKSMLSGEFGGGVELTSYSYWSHLSALAKEQLAEAQEDLADILKGTSITVKDDVLLQVATNQLKVEKSQMALEDAQTAVDDANTAVNDAQLAVDDAKTAVTNAQLDVDDAKSSVADAQSALAEAKSLSPIIKAPFDGFITSVKVAGGDEVYKGTVAMQIADPNQFAAKILVTEEDVSSVSVGENATVSLSALSDLTFPARITKIAPKATVSSGVVNYAVTVSVTSLQPITAGQNIVNQPPSQPATGAAPSGALPAGTPPAISPQGSPSANQTAGFAPASSSTGTSTNASSSQNVTLRDGLSATVSIISQHKDNILTIPSKTITRQGQSSTVEVVKGTGTETRVVKTGMTDGTNTEITEGLSEGEQVVIKTSTSSKSSTTNSNNPPAGIPGLGGPPPGGGF